MFTAQMHKWGNLMSTVSSPAFLYLWEWHPSINGSKEYRAFHAAEVPYVFGQFDMFDLDQNEEDLEFSQQMIEMWTNFAKNGNPSTGNIIWPEFKNTSKQYIILGNTIEDEEEGKALKDREELRLKKVQLINESYDKARVIFEK